MRDIRAIRFEKTADSAFSEQPDSRNLLPEQSHLPAFYQALRQRGQVSQDGIFAILRDLAERVDAQRVIRISLKDQHLPRTKKIHRSKYDI
jgi:hypothetical protein